PPRCCRKTRSTSSGCPNCSQWLSDEPAPPAHATAAPVDAQFDLPRNAPATAMGTVAEPRAPENQHFFSTLLVVRSIQTIHSSTRNNATAKTPPHRRRPVPIAGMDPGLRREV